MPRPESTDMATASPKPKRRSKRLARPFTDALLTAIAKSGLSYYELEKATGVLDQTIAKFVRGEVNLKLATVAKLFNFLGLKVVRRSNASVDDLPQNLPEALRSALAEDPRSIHSLARAAGVTPIHAYEFSRCKRDMGLASADKFAIVLGLEVVREAQRPESGVGADPPARPVTDALRSAIFDDPRRITPLARDAAVDAGSVSRFVRGEVDLGLARAAKLANEVGVKLVRESNASLDDLPRNLPDALRSALAEDPRSIPSLARAAIVIEDTLYAFMRGEKDLMLATADKLVNVLPVKVVREVRCLEPKPFIRDPIQPSMDELRAAIAGKGLSVYSLSKRSHVSTQTIADLIRGHGNLKYSTAIRLANALEFKLEPAKILARSDAPLPSAGPTSASRDSATGGDQSIDQAASISQASPPAQIASPTGSGFELTRSQSKVIECLKDAGRQGLTGATLRVISGVPRWWQALKDLENHPEHGPKIHFPGQGKRLYRYY